MTIVLYVLALTGLIFSLIKSKDKTKKALKKAWKAFERILPQFLVIIIIIGLMLSILNAEQISKLIGSGSGAAGVIAASIIGSITLIPAFVAFPLAAALLESGAGYMQIAAFVSTLMIVGIITMPLEIKYFGRKVTIIRNIIGYIFSIIVAMIIGLAM